MLKKLNRERKMDNEVNSNFIASPIQRRLWSLQRIDGSQSYKVQFSIRIEGMVDVVTLKNAINKTIAKHEILHTGFKYNEIYKTLEQVVKDRGSTVIDEIAISNVNRDGSQFTNLDDIIDRVGGFDIGIGRDPLVRFGLIKESSTQYLLVICASALVLDYTSMGVIFEDICNTYGQLARGQSEINLDVIQFGDVAEYMNGISDSLKASMVEDDREDQDVSSINGISMLLENKLKSWNGFVFEKSETIISGELSRDVEALAVRFAGTMSDVMLACWMILITKIVQDQNVTIGVANDGRLLGDFKGVCGPFTLYASTNCTIRPSDTLGDVIRKIKQWNLEEQYWVVSQFEICPKSPDLWHADCLVNHLNR